MLACSVNCSNSTNGVNWTTPLTIKLVTFIVATSIRHQHNSIPSADLSTSTVVELPVFWEAIIILLNLLPKEIIQHFINSNVFYQKVDAITWSLNFYSYKKVRSFHFLKGIFIFNYFKLKSYWTVISMQGCPVLLFFLSDPESAEKSISLHMKAFSGVSLPGGTESPPTSGVHPTFLQLQKKISYKFYRI